MRMDPHTHTHTLAQTIQIQYNDYYLTNNFYHSPKLTLLLLFTLINFSSMKLLCHAMLTCININIHSLIQSPYTYHHPPTHTNTSANILDANLKGYFS